MSGPASTDPPAVAGASALVGRVALARRRASLAVTAEPAAPAGGPASVTFSWLSLGVVLLATFMSQFGFIAVGVAVPSVQRDLGASYPAVQWVVTGYLLPFALLLVSGGRLGDIVGRRRSFVWSVAGFTAASVLAGVAADVRVLVGARVLQGVAAAVMSPQVLAALRVLVPAGRRGPVLAAYAGVVSLATISGPLLGGVLVQADLFGWGWRVLFLVNVPLGVLAVVGGRVFLPESRSGQALRLDLGQVLFAAVALLLLVYPLMHGREQGWPWWCWAALAGSGPALALFVWHQWRVERTRGAGAALVPLHLFRQSAFTAGLLTSFIVSALLAGFFVVFAIFLQAGLGFSAGHVGVTMAPWAVGCALGSIAAIPLSRRFGRVTLLAGGVLMAAGMAALALALVWSGAAVSGGDVLAGLFVFGVGVTMVAAPVLDLTLAAIPAGDAGAASGVFNTFKQTGSAFGVMLNGAVFFALLGDDVMVDRADYVQAMRYTTFFDLASCLVALMLVFLLPRRVRHDDGVRAGHGRRSPAGAALG